MNNPTQAPQSQEVSLEQAYETVALGEAVERLYQNPDFKKVMIEGFLERGVMNKVSLLAVESQKPHREEILKELDAAAIINLYLINIANAGRKTADDIADFLADERMENETEEEIAEL